MNYRFDKIAFNSTAKKTPTESDKEHYIGLEHIDSECLEITRWGSNVAPIGEKLIMKKGDILFGKRRAYQRKLAIAPFDGIFSAHGMVLRPNEEVVDKNYFPFFMSSDLFMERAVQISVGGLSPTINWKDLREQEFPLPSLAEQKVLADKLWAAYRLKESYKKLLAATEEMVKSQFIEMFYNEKYPLQKLKTHIDVIRGVSYKPVDIKEETSDSISVILRSNNIINGQINFDDVVYVDNKRVTTEQVLSKGDIVMCGSNGSKKLVGKAAMINTIPSYRTSFGAFCLGIRCKESILPEYLSVYFQTPKYREVIEFLGSGSNILNIKPEHIYNLEIPIPSLEDQKHFVTIAEQADKSGFEIRKSIEAIDNVIKSLING
ncbi:restriction endonuclease subunit S [Segatella baroniae B14]|uniref:Type I restriction-modification system, endonuclease S subunit n=1 Tax=Segatella baroniae B14 TaxID=752555 RepID=D8DYA6_9BACT|nr:restriction endonuclease subunit S [Segatella baroniae]EFI71584.1 type I restriction-modification system, endonuclease S subunit [Segatella baroniae B14]UKK79314.1 restriction endonuclease subunit S [Segatella baroniae B14]